MIAYVIFSSIVKLSYAEKSSILQAPLLNRDPNFGLFSLYTYHDPTLKPNILALNCSKHLVLIFLGNFGP